MATYSVDGVPMDHPAECWKLLSSTPCTAVTGVRAAAVAVPGHPR
jgi:hypothetical protein